MLDDPRGHVVKGGVDAWEHRDAGVVLAGVGHPVSPPNVERGEPSRQVVSDSDRGLLASVGTRRTVVELDATGTSTGEARGGADSHSAESNGPESSAGAVGASGAGSGSSSAGDVGVGAGDVGISAGDVGLSAGDVGLSAGPVGHGGGVPSSEDDGTAITPRPNNAALAACCRLHRSPPGRR